jgi:glycosyltransferase involved in cell wall biosynthesis
MNKIKVIKVNSKISKLSRIFKRFDYAIFPNENIDNTYIRNLKTSLKINGKKVVTYKKFLFYFIFNYQSIIINWYDKYSLSRLFFILLAKYIFGVKIIKILHNKQPHDRKKNKLDYFTNKYSDMIILMSHDSEKHLYEYNKKALHLFHPNYIDDFQFFKKTKSVKLRILVFGLIRPYKGIDQIIEVFKNVDAIEVTIAGKSIDNDYLSLIKTMISECNNISLIPRSLNNLEVSSIFSNTDILLLNYDISSFLISGTAILAFSLKTPVLTKRLGMFNDDTFNDACYFFEDNIDLINMTKKLVYEKDMLELKGKNGYDIVKFNTWNNFALMLINETKNRFK